MTLESEIERLKDKARGSKQLRSGEKTDAMLTFLLILARRLDADPDIGFKDYEDLLRDLVKNFPT